MLRSTVLFITLVAVTLTTRVEAWMPAPRISAYRCTVAPSRCRSPVSLVPLPPRTVLLSSAALPETTAATSSEPLHPEMPEPTMETSSLPQEMISADFIKKCTNALLLVAAFGYAIYTIFNIDEGMTRGWTQGEIAMRIPLDNWANYEESLADKPIYTKTLINVVIYLLGDWLSQTVFQKKNILDFDASRTLKNGFIGLCFGPLVHEYYQFSDHILPVDGPNSLVNRLEKIFMDQTVYLSVKASIYVAAVALLAGESWQTARDNVQEKIGGIVLTAWKFWPLIHCLTYSVIPAQHRILWVNCVDLVWNAILASMSSASAEETEEQAAIEAGKADLLEGDALFVMRQDVIPVLDDDSSIFANNTSVAPENATVY